MTALIILAGLAGTIALWAIATAGTTVVWLSSPEYSAAWQPAWVAIKQVVGKVPLSAPKKALDYLREPYETGKSGSVTSHVMFFTTLVFLVIAALAVFQLNIVTARELFAGTANWSKLFGVFGVATVVGLAYTIFEMGAALGYGLAIEKIKELKAAGADDEAGSYVWLKRGSIALAVLLLVGEGFMALRRNVMENGDNSDVTELIPMLIVSIGLPILLMVLTFVLKVLLDSVGPTIVAALHLCGLLILTPLWLTFWTIAIPLGLVVLLVLGMAASGGFFVHIASIIVKALKSAISNNKVA